MSRLAPAIAALALSLPAWALDHSHQAWQALLAKHVRYLPGGNASQVAYADFMKDRAALRRVLDEYQAVTRAEFDGWSKAEQQAFLINAYNAFTIEKVLRRERDLDDGARLEAQLEDAMRRYLADRPEDRAAVREQRAAIAFLDYDWGLNDTH
jgi:flagellar motor protein MotB